MRQPEMVKEGSAVMIVDRSYFGTDIPKCPLDSWQARATVVVPFEDIAGTLPVATCLCHWRTALNVVHDSISGAMCHGVLWPVLALGVVLMPFLVQQHSQPAPITVQQAFPSRTFVGCA